MDALDVRSRRDTQRAKRRIVISDDEREDVWTFLDARGVPVSVDVIVIDYPDQPGRSLFVSGATKDGRIVHFEDGKYFCDDGTPLQLPCV